MRSGAEDGTESLPNLASEDLFLMDGWRKWFLDLESTPGEDAINVIEITAKNSEYYVHLVDKPVAGFERIDSNFERSTTMNKMLTDSSACYREIIPERNNGFS